MSSELQPNESLRENSKVYARYHVYHCDKCDMNVSMKDLAEHVATKHRGLRFDEEPSSDTDGDLERMDNRLGRNTKLKKQSTKYSKLAQTSGDETDFHQFHPNLSLKNGLFDDDGKVVTSTPNGTGQNVRLRARSPNGRRSAYKWQTARSFNNRSSMEYIGDGAEMVQNRQRKIPTAHELFDYSRSSWEFRTPKVVDGDGENGKIRRYGSTFKRRIIPVKPTPVIPENFESCQFCSNVMHQDYMRAHIERKHRQSSNIDAEINGNNSISNDQTNVGSGTDSGIPVGDTIGANIIGNIKKSTEPMFIRCKYCSAHMHIHYMPLHLVRKHRSEYDDSVGFCWTKYTDDQLNKLIKANRVSVKNGAIYVNDSE